MTKMEDSQIVKKINKKSTKKTLSVDGNDRGRKTIVSRGMQSMYVNTPVRPSSW